MEIAVDVSKISKTFSRNFTFISMFFQNLAFILHSFQQFLLKPMLIISHKMILSKTGCVTLYNYANMRKGICSYNLVFNLF